MLFPGVGTVVSERSLAISLLLRFIRNTFVHDAVVEGEKWFHGRARNEVTICSMINVLERAMRDVLRHECGETKGL